MKKIFFLAATMMAAMTINAADGFDGRDGSLGTQIYAEGVEANSLVQDRSNVTLKETDTSAHKYEINLTEGGECTFTMGGVTFWYKNSAAGTVAYKTYGTYIQPNGNKRKITIPVISGKTIKIGVQDAIKVAVEGATTSTIDLAAWGENKDVLTTITPSLGATEIVIWSDLRDDAYTAAKLKLGAVLYEGEDTANENVKAEVKAVKSIDANGQLVILKNGVKYNALGAVVE